MRKITAIVAITSILASSTFVYAEKDTNELNEELKQNRAKQESLDVEIKSINENIEEIESKIKSSKEEIESLQEEMDKSQEEIEELTEKIDENKEFLGDRVKVISGNYSMNMVKVVLSSDSISDFFNNMYIVKKVVEQDKELLAELDEDKKEIETKQDEIESKQEKQEDLKKSLEEDSKVIEEEKKELQGLRSDLEEKEEALHDEITKIAEEAARKQEEEEKKAQEANKTESSSSNNNNSSSGQVIGDGSWPVPGHTRISSPYGYRTHPVLGTQKLHTGIDIPAPTGTPIVSVDNGTVVYSGVQGSYGNVVMVQHSGGKLSLYAHNSQNTVSVGQKVQKGQVIAKIGSTGMSTGPHVHFEIRINGQHTNPTAYVRP